MSYRIEGVPLIPQSKSMACWYASAQMVVQWRRERCQATYMDEPDPSEEAWSVNTESANNGLGLGEMTYYAQLLGMRSVPPLCPTLEAVEDWMRIYGPLWAAGKKVNGAKAYGHAFVILGVDSGQLLVHDPEPLNVGTRSWKSDSWLATLLSLSSDIPFNFMHYPGAAC